MSLHADPAAAHSLRPENDRESFVRRLQWTLGIRLVVVSLLLGATLMMQSASALDLTAFTPASIWAVMGTAYAMSLGSAIWLKRGRNVAPVGVLQVGWDLLAVTALVYLSGGAGSVFSFLYGVVFLVAAMLVGPGTLQIVTALGISAYAIVGVCTAHGWLPLPPDQPPSRYELSGAELGFFLLANTLGLSVVALLGSNLAARLRKAGGDLRRAEESVAGLARLNDCIIRSLSSGLVTTSPKGLIQSINPAGAAMFQITPERMIGRPLAEFLPLDSAPPETEHRRGEGTASRPDGSRFLVGYTANPLVGPDEQSIGSLYSFQDLTEIVELRRKAERAERLAQLGRLAASLAHEIRNPLGSISGSVELVREAAGLGEEDRNLLSVVSAEVDRLNELVTTMLDVGRPNEPQRSIVNLTQLAGEVAQIAQSGSRLSHGIRVDVAAEEEEVTACVDPSQIRQVLWNLVKNAVQASQPGDVVHVSVRKHADDRVELTVKDAGVGISHASKDKLFEMFYSGRPQGVGLGLALVKQTIDAHHGSIEVESQPGQGSVFRVLLPSSQGSH